MDHGTIIARGAPKDLLKEHFEETIIEIPVQENVDLRTHFKNTFRTDKYDEIVVKDLNEALSILSKLDLDLSGMNVRQKNLEDLFIHLTGQELRG